jgi:diadenosine tetraphosphate (Ap4A) HIT family hydrolase
VTKLTLITEKKMAKISLQTACTLCEEVGGLLIWSNTVCRVVDANDPKYPGLTRVIWSAHVAEMTDLSPDQQQYFMRVVLTVENVMRHQLKPHKINLASLGNYVPHLHWHVIPRWPDDATFPDSIWGAEQRHDDMALARCDAINFILPAYQTILKQRLAHDFSHSCDSKV